MPGQGPGFFGKLRTNGDFVARRLPPALRLGLDAWLQQALLCSRHDLGANWLPAWLNGPLWRFVLAPGLCGPAACAGVMMPSMDRVDRTFPLVIALELAGAPSPAACIGPHAGWFAALEDLALSTLDRDFSIDTFDAALCALEGAPAASGRSVRDAAPSGTAWFAMLDGTRAPALAHAALEGRSAWWTLGAPAVAPVLAMCDGLPAPAAFAALLDGAWEARGWRRS